MSALASVRVPTFSSSRAVSEAELIRCIGRVTWSSKTLERAFDSLAGYFAKLPGHNGFEFRPHDVISHLRYSSLNLRLVDLSSTVTAQVAASGLLWGEVSVFFDGRSLALIEDPARFVQFLGEQLGLLLHRLSLEEERGRSHSQLAHLQQVIRRRKLIYGAASLLARQTNTSQDEALRQMIRFGRQHRRRLLAIAESLILGNSIHATTRPFFRRLGSSELTNGRVGASG